MPIQTTRSSSMSRMNMKQILLFLVMVHEFLTTRVDRVYRQHLQWKTRVELL